MEGLRREDVWEVGIENVFACVSACRDNVYWDNIGIMLTAVSECTVKCETRNEVNAA